MIEESEYQKTLQEVFFRLGKLAYKVWERENNHPVWFRWFCPYYRGYSQALSDAAEMINKMRKEERSKMGVTK